MMCDFVKICYEIAEEFLNKDIVADHPRWLFCVYVLQALGLPVHVCKPSIYVLKPPKLVALREVARDNIYLRLIMIGFVKCHVVMDI